MFQGSGNGQRGFAIPVGNLEVSRGRQQQIDALQVALPNAVWPLLLTWFTSQPALISRTKALGWKLELADLFPSTNSYQGLISK